MEVLDIGSISTGNVTIVAVGWAADYLYEVADALVEDIVRRQNNGLMLSQEMLAAFDNLTDLVADGVFESDYGIVNAAVNDLIVLFLKESIGYYGKVEYCSHHLAHAGSVYYSYTWDKALVITSDGKGCGLSSTVSVAENGKISKLSQTTDVHSIANFYAAVTRYVGFKANCHEGKITGLAAFGDGSANYSSCRDLFRYDQDGKTIVSSLEDIWTEWKECDSWKDNVECIYDPEKDGGTLNSIYHSDGHIRQYRANYLIFKHIFDEKLPDKLPKDIAAFAQKLLEKVVVEQVSDAVNISKCENICLAGGLFANVKLNQRIREIPGVENVYIYPAMGDSGTSAGAALCSYYSSQKFSPEANAVLDRVYLGRGYDKERIYQAVTDAGYSFNWQEDAELRIADYIHNGKIVGLYNGRAEWGPRALGNRSILVRPIDKSINDDLNKRLKRTEFMPFAPVVLAEYASEYFKGYRSDHIAANYMTMTYDVFPEKASYCEAVVHIDLTARPQVLFKHENEYYYNIIKAYYMLSGVPMIVNTSFNIHEEPMVYTPEDAIRAFEADAVDVLVLGKCIINK